MPIPSPTRVTYRHLMSGYLDEKPECPPDKVEELAKEFQKDCEAELRKDILPALKRRGWKIEEAYVYDWDDYQPNLLDVYIDVSAKAGQKIGLGGRKYIVLDRNVRYQDDQQFGFSGENTENDFKYWDDDEGLYQYETSECPPEWADALVEGRNTYPLNAAGVERLLAGFDKRWLRKTGVRSKVHKKASTNTERYFYKATDGKWYVDNEDYDEDEDGEQIEGDTTTYGPFPSFKAAEKWVNRSFANSGGYSEDDSGRERPPRNPVRPHGRRWAAKRFGSDMADDSRHRRWAFNKYNPDELLMQLVEILEKYELDDAVDAVKKVTPAVQRAWRQRERLASVSRVTSRHIEARNPPLYEAAEADEALGTAYTSLVNLKLGFDSWEEIPPSAIKLYDLIGKAMGLVGKARKETYQIRMMVQRGKYGSNKTARTRMDWAKLFRKGSYFNMFFSEKEIPDRVFSKRDKNGVEHSIPNGVVVEFISQTGSGEMRKLEDVVRKIDFANGDVNHFLEHLAGAIADQYSGVRLAFFQRNPSLEKG